MNDILINQEEIDFIVSEYEKCCKSPHYFAKNYLIIGDKKFTTLSEEIFNAKINQNIGVIIHGRKGNRLVFKSNHIPDTINLTIENWEGPIPQEGNFLRWNDGIRIVQHVEFDIFKPGNIIITVN